MALRDLVVGHVEHERRRLGAYAEARLTLLSPSRRQRFELTLATVDRHCGDRQGVRLLDAGCGDALLSVALGRRDPTWQVVGIDASPSALEQARHRVLASGLDNVELVAGDLTGEIGGAQYDVIAAIECLEEIEDDRAALRTLASALEPDGLLIVHVPAHDWRPVLPGSASTWRHEVRHGYTRAELVDLIEDAGLTVLDVHGTYRRLVQSMQEVRDRIKARSLLLRSLALPLMKLAVRLEAAGLTWGREQALIAVAVRTRLSNRSSP
jgi:2-polyprenyl-3-methyl-5-hydroxy-6-metoxy-1,4-benzoquinol methylase